MISGTHEHGAARVLVVDDHPFVCDGVRLLLSGSDLAVVGCASDAERALRMTADEQPDLVLLDLRLPGVDPAALVHQLRGVRPDLRIVIFTAYPERSLVLAVLAAGVQGCLLKDVGAADLASSLMRVLQGTRVMDPRCLPSGGAEGSEPGSPVDADLTARERDVLQLVALGLTNPEIAERLGLTRNTVKSYLQSTLQKLGVRNRVEAIARAAEQRIL